MLEQTHVNEEDGGCSGSSEEEITSGANTKEKNGNIWL
jgi:hypothetical protein